MKEIHALCLQLEQIMKQDVLVDSQGLPDFSTSHFEMPNEKQCLILQQAILSGFVENLSRKAPIFDAMGNEIKQTNKSKCFYESQETDQKLSIHQYSGLSGKNQPENLIYSEIYTVESKTFDGETKVVNYMKGVTKIDSLAWLSNLGSQLLIQRSLPIHEHSARALSSLESRKELMMAKMINKNKSLISYNKKTDEV